MLIKTSKWGILYYFFNNLWRQLFSIIIFISSIIVGIDSKVLILFVFVFSLIKIVRGVFLSKAITIHADNQGIVVDRKLVSEKQIKILKYDIQSIKTRESFFGRIVGVVDLDISIKGNVLEEQNIRIKCITKKDRDNILSCMNEKIKVDKIDLNKEWTISIKQIVLSSMMSVSWTYILSLVYLREDIKEIGNIQFVKRIVVIFEYVFNQKYEVLNYLEIFFIGLIISVIVNVFKYYRFKIHIDNGNIYISRGMLDLYKLNINVNEISSFLIKESVFSMIGGYGKLLAEGQSDEDDTLSLTIFPCEKKQKIKYYLSNWFQIKMDYKYIVRKETIVKCFECFWILTLFFWVNVLAYQKLLNKYYFLFLVLTICITINTIIKICCSYISADEKNMVLYKAGINSKTIYIRNFDVVSLEVENNFLQRMFSVTNFCINYISCNEEYSVNFRGYNKKQIDEIIWVWRKGLQEKQNK